MTGKRKQASNISPLSKSERYKKTLQKSQSRDIKCELALQKILEIYAKFKDNILNLKEKLHKKNESSKFTEVSHPCQSINKLEILISIKKITVQLKHFLSSEVIRVSSIYPAFFHNDFHFLLILFPVFLVELGCHIVSRGVGVWLIQQRLQRD